jgi:GTPase SAR1 family protein
LCLPVPHDTRYVKNVEWAQQRLALIRRASSSDEVRTSANGVQGAFHIRGVSFAPLRRAKVILCGQGRVGKTSLRKALTGVGFDADEQSTAGAAVTCALRRVEADQADGEWSVHDVDRSSLEGQCMSEAEVTYLTQRCGTDAAAWVASLRLSMQSADHDDPSDDDGSGYAGDDEDIDSTRGSHGTESVGSKQDHSVGVGVVNIGVDSNAAAAHVELDTRSFADAPAQFHPNPSPIDNDSRTYRLLDEREARITAELAALDASGGDLPIKVSVWDLGGQRLFQALQQLFLTKSAIYVVTFCLTHFTDEAGDGGEAAAELRFWCDTVASCARCNSEGEKGRVVLVGTCMDQIGSEADVVAARQRAADVVGSTLLRGVVSVNDILCVDNSRLDGSRSIAGLRGVLDRHISESFDVKVPVR